LDRPKEPKRVSISEELLSKCDLPNQPERFDAMVRKLLSVPHSEIIRREQEYKRRSALNPNRRGPKPKAKA
jgi:hypothetical protein